MFSLVSCSTLTSLLISLFNSSSSDTYCIHLHIFLHLLLHLAISNSLSPTLLFSFFFHILLLAHHSITKLSLLSTFYLLVYILFLFLTPSFLLLAICLPLTSYVTNFIQLVSQQPLDRFSQTKLHWKAPNEGYPYIYEMYKSDNK